MFWKIFVNFLTSTLLCAQNTTLLSKVRRRFSSNFVAFSENPNFTCYYVPSTIFKSFLLHCVATAVAAGRCTQPLPKSARQSRWEKRYHHIQIQIGVIKCQRTRPLGSSSAWDLTSWLEDSFHSLNRFNEAKSRLSWLLLHVFCTSGAPEQEQKGCKNFRIR